MSGGLVALLDDVAALARLAAASVDDVAAAAGKASAKAAGVVVDDAAVTPQYVSNVEPNRELSIIKRIAKGSMRNKLVFILPALLLLSVVWPELLTPILMIGGTYLCFEGAEKIWHILHPHHEQLQEPASVRGPEAEDKVVAGAVRTDFILSMEIMVIALTEVASESFLTRAVVLAIVAIFITVLVYGVVGLIVRMDDIGLSLAEGGSTWGLRTGMALVKAMPKVLSALSTIGIVAMLWVGGHILLVGTANLGWHWPYDQVHHLEHWVTEVAPFADSFFGWVANTAAAALCGLLVGALAVLVFNGVKRIRRPA